MRAEIRVSGIVQGVGFRPFVYRIAVKNGLVGYIRNRGDAFVEIMVEGKKGSVDQFLLNLRGKDVLNLKLVLKGISLKPRRWFTKSSLEETVIQLRTWLAPPSPT